MTVEDAIFLQLRVIMISCLLDASLLLLNSYALLSLNRQLAAQYGRLSRELHRSLRSQ